MKPNPIILINKINKSYSLGGSSFKVLKNVSLEVEKGEFIVIEGKSGSGKTTLLNIISGLDKPDSGSVEIAGKILSSFNSKEVDKFRSQKIGLVFQSFNLLSGLTAIQNVALSGYVLGYSKEEANKIARQAIDYVGLKTRLGHKPSQMSGGEQQRISIARAIATNPDIILCDEPTGNLDSETGAKIIELLQKINKKYGSTIIIATHDKDLIRIASRVITIKDGNIS